MKLTSGHGYIEKDQRGFYRTKLIIVIDDGKPFSRCYGEISLNHNKRDEAFKPINVMIEALEKYINENPSFNYQTK